MLEERGIVSLSPQFVPSAIPGNWTNIEAMILGIERFLPICVMFAGYGQFVLYARTMSHLID